MQSVSNACFFYVEQQLHLYFSPNF